MTASAALVTDLEALHALRLARWRQTPQQRITEPGQALPLIEQCGVATLFPVSSELPNLYHAYMGDPDAKTDSEWDSPSGEVYTWRWILGRREAAFYTALVRGRPTWVSWALLPAMMRLRGELRALDELVDMGAITPHAYRVAQALEEAGGVLSTGELRARAGFPTGKDQRAAYLKAVDELDTRLLLAKVFTTRGDTAAGDSDGNAAEGESMSHALVALRYPDHVAAAELLTREEALDQFLVAYLPSAVYAVPTVLARHLKLPEDEVRTGLERLVDANRAVAVTFAAHKGACYAWKS